MNVTKNTDHARRCRAAAPGEASGRRPPGEKGASRQAQQAGAGILAVAGRARTPPAAATALGVSWRALLPDGNSGPCRTCGRVGATPRGRGRGRRPTRRPSAAGNERLQRRAGAISKRGAVWCSAAWACAAGGAGAEQGAGKKTPAEPAVARALAVEERMAGRCGGGWRPAPGAREKQLSTEQASRALGAVVRHDGAPGRQGAARESRHGGRPCAAVIRGVWKVDAVAGRRQPRSGSR